MIEIQYLNYHIVKVKNFLVNISLPCV